MKEIANLKNVTKSYMENDVLKNIDVQLNEGRFYALLGENGAGKSTILKILMGIERHNKGSGHLLGNPIGNDNPDWRREVGYVAEHVEYDCPLSVKKFFNFYREFFPRWNQELFDKIMAHQNFDLYRKFSRYSRGQKMQLVLTGELCKSPKVLLIDEITSVLDVNSREFFLGLLLDFQNAGGTILLTTNIIKEIQHVATDILIIKEGEITVQAELAGVTNYFYKIHKNPQNADHPLFGNSSCHFAGSLGNGNEVYLAPQHLIYETGFPTTDILDSPVTIEDIFLYAVGKKDVEHEGNSSEEEKLDYAEAS